MHSLTNWFHYEKILHSGHDEEISVAPVFSLDARDPLTIREIHHRDHCAAVVPHTITISKYNQAFVFLLFLQGRIYLVNHRDLSIHIE